MAQPEGEAEQVEGQDEEFVFHLDKGSGLLSGGDAEGARAALGRALELRPRDPNVLGLLGQACYRLTRYDEAIAAWQRLVEESPAEPAARVNLGLAFLRAHRQAEAIRQLQIALDLNPEHRKAMGYLGLALLESGDPRRAREWFHKAGSDQMVARCNEILSRSEAEATPAPQVPEPAPAAPEPAADTAPPMEEAPVAPPELAPPVALDAEARETEPVVVETVEPATEPDVAAMPEPAAEAEPEPLEEGGAEAVMEPSGGSLPEPVFEPAFEPLAQSFMDPAMEVVPGPVQTLDLVDDAVLVPVIDPEPDPEPPYEDGPPEVAKRLEEPVPVADDAALPVDVDLEEVGDEPVPAVEPEPVLVEASLLPEPPPAEPPPEEFLPQKTSPVSPAEAIASPVVPDQISEEPPANSSPSLSRLAQSALSIPEIAAYAATRQIEVPDSATFNLVDGLVAVRVRTAVRVRLRGLLAARGPLRAEPEVKRFRGRPTERHFGEGDARLHRIQGDGLLLFASGASRFTPLALGVEPAFFREEALFAFEEALSFDNGRVPSPGGGELNLVHLRGQGAVLIVTAREPRAIEVAPDAPLRVPVTALVGWVGALTPRLVTLLEGGLAGALGVELSGVGTVLVDPGRGGAAEES